ncbi:MAG: ribosome maturation factor RimP [Candidatus Cloacimonetes bacterium]|nr:ribosome maturation factor RimP [Candidatus Cloacimonadota bacterium]
MDIDKKLNEIIIKVSQKMGFQIYDWQLKGTRNNHLVIVYITKQGGVTLDDCQRVSQKLGDELDMRDIFDTRYTLEVSSPGLNRLLKTTQHFLGAIGRVVKVQYVNEEGKVKTANGILKSIDNNVISVKIDNEDSTHINFAQIKKAKTVYKWLSKS